MAQWSGSDSGILRKNPRPENHEELLVFGYSCKLFRDDEKALYIDQGKHLIPWMGDDTLKIDRYDCRGALSDLRKYEASREGFDAMRWLGLSEKDRQLEELCDKERYYSLEINEEEEEMYKEEEQKRQKTNTFQYSYDVPTDPEKKEEGPIGPEANDEEEYVPLPILDVPVDIDIPKTVKENARIEKTAKFVCKQGPQMEILIKAKQGNNPQFSFLNQGDRLYKFYRHVLAAFKNGRYQGYEPIIENNAEDKLDAHDADAGDHYLHPSLLSATQQPEPLTTIAIPQVPYKPSANCAYSQLVNRIQGNQNDQAQEAEKASAPAANFAQMTYEQQQYYQYYYAQQYYEYYKQMALFQQGHGGNPGQFVPPADFQNLDPNLQSYIQQIAYSQYLQHQQQQQQQSDNSYAQIVSNVNKEVHNPYAANVPQLPQNVPQKEETELPGNSPSIENVVREITPKTEVIIKKPLLSLAAYGSGSDSESEDTTEEEEGGEEKKEVYKVPSGDTQVIIDKMALYVSKNGDQFETLVKARGDPRFHFLNEEHEYNKYYKEKIRELRGSPKNDEVVEKREVKEVKPSKKEKKVIAPVSFSIKKAKEEQPKEIKSALPVEESDEEEPESVAPPAPVVPSIVNPPASTTICVDENSESPQETSETITNKEEKEPEVKEATKDNKKNGILDVDDPILEMIELTSGEIVEDKKDTRRAEDKIKDKLAAAAREKLASASRDRALQLERKKKAAAFLKLKSAESNTQSNDSATPDKSSPSKPSSRRNSVEIIEILSSPPKKSRDKSRSRDREKRKDRESKERRKEERQRKAKDRERSREKKRSKSPRREVPEEEMENKRRKEEDKKEKKKKSHKRKHSKSRHESRSKKKSKKRHRRSESESSNSNSS